MPIPAEQRKRFEALGADVVRGDIGMGYFLQDDIQHHAIEWVAEQDRAQRRRDSVRFWSMLILTAIAAVAACVAAWPVIKGG